MWNEVHSFKSSQFWGFIFSFTKTFFFFFPLLRTSGKDRLSLFSWADGQRFFLVPLLLRRVHLKAPGFCHLHYCYSCPPPLLPSSPYLLRWSVPSTAVRGNSCVVALVVAAEPRLVRSPLLSVVPPSTLSLVHCVPVPRCPYCNVQIGTLLTALVLALPPGD